MITLSELPMNYIQHMEKMTADYCRMRTVLLQVYDAANPPLTLHREGPNVRYNPNEAFERLENVLQLVREELFQ